MQSTIPYCNAEGPVIVQGNSAVGESFPSNGDWKRGEKQSNKCQDLIWAILFYAHLLVLAVLMGKYAPLMTTSLAEDYAISNHMNRRLDEGQETNGFDLELGQICFMFIAIAGFSTIFSTLAMMLLSNSGQLLVKVALLFNIFATLSIGILAFGAGSPSTLLFCVGTSLFASYWSYCVWPRIPFAQSTLLTGITVVKMNSGLVFLAFSSLLLSVLWTIWWALSFVSTNYVLGDCTPDGSCEGELNGFFIFLFLVSYFWTAQVLKNVVHVSVAGTVATWWYSPLQASNFCSQAVKDSYTRSMTTSFGSICLGSLLVSIVSAMKEVLHAMREQGNSISRCVSELLLGCLESAVEYFNSWAFVYVGLHQTSFMEAGKNVMALFQSRGWSVVANDILVDTVLLMISLAVAILTGLSMVLLTSVSGWNQQMMGVALVAGLLVGFILCTTTFSLISSAVNAVIVCYAEAPAEFQANQPQLSEDMRCAWQQAYSNELQY